MLVLFILLLIFDVVLVFSTKSGFPTISRIALHATPKFVVIIWLFGVLTGNVFFPRSHPELKLSRMKRLAILTIIGIFYLVLGYQVDQMGSGKACKENIAGSGAVWSFLRAECLSCNSTANMSFVSCESSDADECKATVNFSTDANLCFFLFGMFCGFVFWPQVPNSSNDSDSFINS